MNEKILVIDDETDVCTVVKEALEYEGCRVEIATSGEEALQSLKSVKYDAVMVDIRLGGSISGVDVIRYCGNMTDRPVILVMSATPSRLLEPIFEKEGISLYVDKVLEKPSDLNPDVIPSAVKRVLERHKNRR